MSPIALLPLALCLASAACAWFFPRFMSPRWATQVLCIVVVAAAASTIAALGLVALASLSAIGSFDHLLGWCSDLYGHAAPPWAGVLAAVALGVGGTRLVRSRLRWRRAIAPWRHLHSVRVVPGGAPVAFAVPGDPGAVVIGERLFSELDVDERTVVIEHETAHLRCRHDRYLVAGEMAAAVMPLLAPVAHQLRFATERWADEITAERLGDRRLVARTIAKAALMASGDSPLLPAMADSGAAARVQALMDDGAPPRWSCFTLLLSAGAVGAALGGSSVQLHHLAAFFTHVCG